MLPSIYSFQLVFLFLVTEPLYDELRTRQQLGYNVSCSTRHNKETLGFLIKVVSATHKPAVIAKRIDTFLSDFFAKHLRPMRGKKRAFEEEIKVLAELKLADDNNLMEESELHSDEIMGGTYEFHRAVLDAHALKHVKTSEVVDCFRQALSPESTQRKCLFVFISNMAADNEKENGELAAQKSDASTTIVETPRQTLHSGDAFKYHVFPSRVYSHQ